MHPPASVWGSCGSSTSICMRSPHGANVNGLIVSSVSVLMCLSAYATWNKGERWFLNFLIRSVLLRRGLVSGRVCMFVHIFTARLQKRCSAVAIWASASATLVATVRNVPTSDCTLTLWTRLIRPLALSLKHASRHWRRGPQPAPLSM